MRGGRLLLAGSLCANLAGAVVLAPVARRRLALWAGQRGTGRRLPDGLLSAGVARFGGWSPGRVVLVGDSQFDHAPILDLLDLPVRNRAVSGATVADTLEWIDDVLAERPEQVVLFIGSNDACYGVPAEPTRRALDDLFSRLAGVPTIVVGLPALPGHDDAVARVNAQLRRHTDAGGHVWIDLAAALAGRSWTPDGLHLDADAYRVLAQLVQPHLR